MLMMFVSGCALVGGSPLEGEPAPAFSLSLLDGGPVSLGDHLGTRPVVLDFWAVWCPPCREALPKVAAAAEAFKDKDVAIYAVNLGDTPESIRSFLEQRSLSLPVLLDSDGSAGALYQVRSIPTMIFIDKTGKVARVVVGSMSEKALRSAITQLL